MKSNLSLVFFMVLALGAYAQPDVTSAFNANKAGDYDKAVTFIEKALSNPKAVDKEKTWRYRGNIYLNILGDSNFSSKYPNASQLAKESYFKAMELDNGNDYVNENRMALANIQSLVLEEASKQYEKGDFCNSANGFLTSAEISAKFGIVDSASIFNNAYCNDRCGRADEALVGYNLSAQIGYNVPDVYVYMADIYTNKGQLEDAKKVISEARKKHPNSVELLRSEVNFLLTDQKYDEALGLLKSLTEKESANATIWFVLGATYEKLGNVEEQEKAYKKAIDIDSEYFDALFNLGATYYNKGVAQLKECEAIPVREQAKYNDCISKGDVFFNKAVENLEKAYNQKKDDKEIMSALMEAYARIGNVEGSNKLRQELEKK